MAASAAVAARRDPDTAPARVDTRPTGSAWGQLARREGLRR
jgi:hypothetical protein